MMMYWTILWFNVNLGCALTEDVIQPDPVIVSHSGRSVYLTCFCPSTLMNSVLWFKQTVGQKPLLMASSSHLSQDNFYFNNFTRDFSGTKRLSVIRGEGSFNLTISKTEPEDSATFYCGALYINKITSAQGTVLIVKGSESKSKSVLQHPVSESIDQRESVTLNCTINTGTCEGEHSVYWFRHDSGESPPGIIYTNGDRSGQCKKNPESGSPTQSCVYNLPKRNLSLSDTGTYYCAVASCGEILFGNGTKLGIQDPFGNQNNPLLIIISFLTTAVILSVIMNIIFCMRGKKTQCEHCAETTSQLGLQGDVHASMSNRQLHDETTMNYASLKFADKKRTQSRRPTREQREIRNQRD